LFTCIGYCAYLFDFQPDIQVQVAIGAIQVSLEAFHAFFSHHIQIDLFVFQTKTENNLIKKIQDNHWGREGMFYT
jgi:hypothetical protein